SVHGVCAGARLSTRVPPGTLPARAAGAVVAPLPLSIAAMLPWVRGSTARSPRFRGTLFASASCTIHPQCSEVGTMIKFFGVLKRAFKDFLEDECMVSGAALAYYTIFALPPLLVLVFFVAGTFGYTQEQISQVVQEQLGM